MPLILAVEPEARYVERIHDALVGEGWEVEAVSGREEALRAAEKTPALVLVNVEVAGAAELCERFGRRYGGPGAVALVPEAQTPQAESVARRADAYLIKPFPSGDLRLTVRRCLSGAQERAKDSEHADPKLTSSDLFGDLLEEFDGRQEPATPGSAPAAAPTPKPAPTPAAAATPKPAPTPAAAAPKPAPTPAAAAPKKPQRPQVSDPEINRKLEETLSGVLDPPRRPGTQAGGSSPASRCAPSASPPPATSSAPGSKAAVPPPAGQEAPAQTQRVPTPKAPLQSTPAQAPGSPPSAPKAPAPASPGSEAPTGKAAAAPVRPAAGAPAKAPARAKRAAPRRSDDDVDALLSRTLLNLDLDKPRTSGGTRPGAAKSSGKAEEKPSEAAAQMPASQAEEKPGEAAAQMPASQAEEKPGVAAGEIELDLEEIAAPVAVPETPAPETPAMEAPAPETPALEPSTLEPLRPEPAPPLASAPGAPLPGTPPPAAGAQAAPSPGDGGPGAEPAGPGASPGALGPKAADEPRLDTFDIPELALPEVELPEPADELSLPELDAQVPDAAEAAAPAPAAVSTAAPGSPPPREPAAGTDRAGREFGQYALLEKIAVGGMAEVWKARMEGLEGFQKTVAIKKILPHLTDNSAFITMFIDEAKLAAQLNHPNVTHIYDLGKIGDDYYIAMEYVEGKNLRALLNAARRHRIRLPTGLSLLIAARLASALDHAHKKRGFDGRELGLVHRDVSPQNVLISYEGDIKLCDFGIVKAVSKASHTQMGALKGKLQYMSPEQAWGRPVDGRSDVFSLGALLFEALTGRRLFTGDNEISVLEAVRTCRIQAPQDLDPSIPDAVNRLVLKALEKKPDDRFQTAGGMQQELEALLYSLRPTPGQGDLGTFMHQLFTGGADLVIADAPPALGDVLATPSGGAAAATPSGEALRATPSSGAGEPAAPGGSDITGSNAGQEDAEGSDTGERGTGETGTGETGTSDTVAAVAPASGSDVEVEEGGSRGRGKLIAAIVVVFVIAVAAGWFVWQRGRETPAGEGAQTGPPAAEEEAPGAVEGEGEGTPAEPGTAEGGGAAAQPAGDDRGTTAAPATGGAAEPTVDVQKMVNEELAKREAELRRQREAELRRLETQLEEVQQQAQETEPASPATPPQPRRDEPAQATSGAADRQARQGAGEARGAGEAAQTPTPAKPTPEPAAPAARPAAGRERDPRAASGAAREAATEGEETQARGPAQRAPPAAQPQQAPAPKPEAVKVGQLVEMGPGVVAPMLVSFDKPQYPPVARRLRVQGVVEVALLVDENGNVVEARLSQPIRQDVGINEAALRASKTAKFKPATKNGVRVKIWTKLRIPFKL